jgi:hypothetical protein
MNRWEAPPASARALLARRNVDQVRADQGHSAHWVVPAWQSRSRHQMDFLVLAGLNHDLSCTNGTRTHSMDTEHQPTDLAVGSSARWLHPFLSS